MSSQSLDTKTNFVCIENKYIQQGDFKLVSNRKGKVFKGPVYNAYTRENLGSIPGKIENVLFKDKLYANRLGFNSQSIRFDNNEVLVTEFDSANKSDVSKGDISRFGNSQSNVLSFNANINTSPSYSRKGFGNGFVSGSERFKTSYNNYENKYLPGPGEHNIKSQTINDSVTRSKRYSKLYKNKLSSGNSKDYDLPGPGYYDIATDLLSKNRQSGNFASSVKDKIKQRLNEKRVDKQMKHVSYSNQYNEHLNTDIPLTHSVNNKEDQSLLNHDASVISSSYNLNISSNGNKSYSTVDQSNVVKKYSNFRGKTKNKFEVDSLYVFNLEKSLEKANIKKVISQKHQIENLVESYVDRKKNSNFDNITSTNKDRSNYLDKAKITNLHQESITNYNLPTEFVNHFHRHSDSVEKGTGVGVATQISNSLSNESLRVAPKGEFLLSNISNVNLKLETEAEKNRKRIEKSRMEEELIKKIQQIKSHPSYFFNSNSSKNEFASKKSHIPGPSYYFPNIIPSHLSFNVNNKVFSNNQIDQDINQKSIWL